MPPASPPAIQSSSWIVRPDPKPAADSRLFCFPFAGGAAATYRLWPAGLPASVEVCALAYPARAHRLRERPVDHMPALVEQIVDALLPWLDKPFSFFGHSMGAIVAAETIRTLEALAAPLPSHFFASARGPAHLPRKESLLHVLPDDELVRELDRRYGGVPREVMEHKELMDLLVPGLRGDLQALELHSPAMRAPLPCPVTVFGGTTDRHVSLDDLRAWRSETLSPLRVRQFEGGHFFIDSARETLLADVSATLSKTSAQAAPSQVLAT